MAAKTILTILLIYTQLIVNAQHTIGSIPLPKGYTRVKCDGYGNYLRNLKLTGSKQIRTYKGDIINRRNTYAVLDIDVGKKDLQQCADAAIRLWAEYLYSIKAYNRIYFHALGNGNAIRFNAWAKKKRSYSYNTFRNYLDHVFAYCNSTSMWREMKSIKPQDLKVGDCFVYINEHTYGHVVTVVDMAVNQKGEKIFMVAQSWMPAQQIHIVTDEQTNSPWYKLTENGIYNISGYTMGKKNMKRFAQ